MSVHDENNATVYRCKQCGEYYRLDGYLVEQGQIHVDRKCKSPWSDELQTRINKTHQMGLDLLETVKNMNIKNYNLDFVESKATNTIADVNLCQAATDIIEIFDQHGFTSDTPPDVELLRHLIVEAIQKRIE